MTNHQQHQWVLNYLHNNTSVESMESAFFIAGKVCLFNCLAGSTQVLANLATTTYGSILAEEYFSLSKSNPQNTPVKVSRGNCVDVQLLRNCGGPHA